MFSYVSVTGGMRSGLRNICKTYLWRPLSHNLWVVLIPGFLRFSTIKESACEELCAGMLLGLKPKTMVRESVGPGC